MPISRRRLFSLFQLPARCVLLLGLVLSGALSAWFFQQEERHAQAEFDSIARTRVVALEHGMDEAADVINDITELFSAFDGKVDREQFRRFARAMQGQHPYIEALAFRRMLRGDQRAAFEAEMRRDFPGFSIVEEVDGKRSVAPARERYAVIDYVEPTYPNDPRIGLNVLHVPEQAGAMQRAAETGLPTGSRLSRFFTRSAERGFRIMLPVFLDATVPVDAAGRWKAVAGYTVAIIYSDQLIKRVLEGPLAENHRGLKLWVYASARAEESDLVYRSEGALGNPHKQPPARWYEYQPKPFTQVFDMAEMPWQIVVTAPPVSLLAVHGSAIAAFLIGLLVTAAATAYIQAASLRTGKIQALVDQRTEELRHANEALVQDVRARTQAEQALLESQAQLRDLAAHREHAKEEERKRIAHDLHDELGQNLMALRLDMAMLASRASTPPAVQAELATLLSHIDTTVEGLRAVINDLRPPALDSGLGAALEWQVRQFERLSGIPCLLQIDGSGRLLDEVHAVTLFRIVQESLTNILKHAHASEVRIAMAQQARSLSLQITDDGIGLAPDARAKDKAFGLAGIEERVHALKGECFIHSAPGQGTTLALTVPL